MRIESSSAAKFAWSTSATTVYGSERGLSTVRIDIIRGHTRNTPRAKALTRLEGVMIFSSRLEPSDVKAAMANSPPTHTKLRCSIV